MYGDQFGEFVCGYWGLKGLHTMLHFIMHTQTCFATLNQLVTLIKLCEY